MDRSRPHGKGQGRASVRRRGRRRRQTACATRHDRGLGVQARRSGARERRVPRQGAKPCQNGLVDLVPVRRDGTGRLVAVGLIEVVDTDGEERWTTIGGPDMAAESIDEAIERCLRETLGSDAHGQLSRPPPVGPTESRPRTNRDEIDEPSAADIWGEVGAAWRRSSVQLVPCHRVAGPFGDRVWQARGPRGLSRGAGRAGAGRASAAVLGRTRGETRH